MCSAKVFFIFLVFDDLIDGVGESGQKVQVLAGAWRFGAFHFGYKGGYVRWIFVVVLDVFGDAVGREAGGGDEDDGGGGERLVDFGGEVKPVGIGEEEVGYDDGEGGLWLCLAVCWLKVFGDDLKGIVFGRGHVDGIACFLQGVFDYEGGRLGVFDQQGGAAGAIRQGRRQNLLAYFAWLCGYRIVIV